MPGPADLPTERASSELVAEADPEDRHTGILCRSYETPGGRQPGRHVVLPGGDGATEDHDRGG